MRRNGLLAVGRGARRKSRWPSRWLKAKRDEIGLTALAKMLGVDTANLGKVTAGRRTPSKALIDKISPIRHLFLTDQNVSEMKNNEA